MTTRKGKRMYKSVIAVSMVVVFVLVGVMPAMYAEAATDYWEDNGSDVYNTNSGNVGIGTNTPSDKLHVNGSFRVESNPDAYLFFVDTSSDMIGIGTNSPSFGLDIHGKDIRIYNPTSYSSLRVDIKGIQGRMGSDLGGFFFACDTNGKDVKLLVTQGGVLSHALRLMGNNQGAIFNEGGLDRDLRVESDGNENMLFVDASTNRVGIGTNTPNEELDVNGDVEVTGNYKYATAKTFYLNIPACEFKRSKTDEDDEIWDFGYIFVQSGSGIFDVDLIAPVNLLPEGATVTNFSVYYMDIDGSNDLAIAHAKLRGYNFIIGNYWEMAEISSISTSGTPAFDYSYDNSIVSGLINNENNVYVILINEYEQDVTGTDLRFYGCRIEFTMTTLKP